MIVVAHRAQDVKEPIPQRFGVEIDVRDSSSGLCLSHDPPKGDFMGPFLDEWLHRGEREDRPLYAVNVKADGIESSLVEWFKPYPSLWSKTCFFDGSYPTMRRLKMLNVPVAERISEEEPYLGFSDIVWLDRWDWVDGDGAIPEGRPTAAGNDKCVRVPLMNNKTGNRTTIYAVSPELHIPNCQPSFRRYWWRRFQEMGCAGICTDHWLEAEEFLK